MPLRKFNKSYYQYRAVYRVHKEDKTEEIKETVWNTDVLYYQVHFWNRKAVTRTIKHKFFEHLISKEKDITQIEVIKEEFVLISRYACEVF